MTNSWEVTYEIRLVRLRRSNPYDKKNIKIKFNSDGELPTNKAIEISSVTKVLELFFYENNKYYPQVFLEECLY